MLRRALFCSLSLLIGALALTLAEPARAQQQPLGRPFGSEATPTRSTVRVEYVRGPGAETCPDERELRGVLAARMGYDPIATDARRSVRIEVTREHRSFLARVSFRDGAGSAEDHRPIQDNDCRRVLDVVALSIVVAIEKAPRSTIDDAAPPLKDTAPTTPIAIAPSKRDERPSLRLGARGALGIGALPALTAALSIDVGVGWPYASLSLEGRMDVPMTGDVDEGRRLNASLFAGSLVPCGHYKWFVGCGLLMVGALKVEGRDIAHPNADTGAFVATGARIGVEWPVIPLLALRFTGDALVTLYPMDAQINGREVWRTPRLTGTVGGGLVLRL